MKKLALLLALPTFAFATDYTRCPMPYEIKIDADGKVKPAEYYDTKSVKTEGNITTMVVKPKSTGSRFGLMMQQESKISIERDDQGRVVAITSGGDRPAKEVIDQWRKMYQGGGLVGGSYGGGFGYGGGYGTLNISSNGQTRQVELKNITDQDLQAIGAKNVKASDVRASANEWSRSSKSQSQLQQVYSAYYQNMPITIPVGSRYEYSVVNGACVPEKIASLNYSSKSDKVEPYSFYDHDACGKVKAAWNKHSAKINECQSYDYNEVGKEQQRLVQDNVLQQLGYGNPGYGYGMGYGGFGMGGYGGGYVTGGMGGGFYGSPAQTLSGYSSMCDMYENWHAMGEGAAQGSGGAAGGGATSGGAPQ